MVLPISINVVHQPAVRAVSARVVEPVCEASNRNEPPTNPFALPPMPFAKFLERENAIDTFQRRPSPPFPLIYGPTTQTQRQATQEQYFGQRVDRFA